MSTSTIAYASKTSLCIYLIIFSMMAATSTPSWVDSVIRLYENILRYINVHIIALHEIDTSEEQVKYYVWSRVIKRAVLSL